MKMKIRIASIAAVILMLMSFPAYALDLHEARSAGLVGEKLDGYIAAVKKTDDVAALVRDVNSKRKQEYARISQENGQPAEVVGQLAAEKIIRKLGPGEYYKAPDGTWMQR
jgi:uncharacterized protein